MPPASAGTDCGGRPGSSSVTACTRRRHRGSCPSTRPACASAADRTPRSDMSPPPRSAGGRCHGSPSGCRCSPRPGGPLHVQRDGVYVRRVPFTVPDTCWAAYPSRDRPPVLFDLARDLELVDLVPVVDAALRASELQRGRCPAAHPPAEQGLPRLRRPWPWLIRAASRSGSRCCASLHVLAGITEIRPQHWIDDAETIRGDLWLVGTRRIVEYDGAEHRQRPATSMTSVGTRRSGARVGALPVRRPGDRAQPRPDPPRLGGGTRPPARAGPAGRWLDYARRSTLTGAGRARLTRRMARYVLAAERPDRV